MKQVAIVGSGPSWVKAPFGEKDWEIWSLNCFFKWPQLKKYATRWFEIHKREKIEAMYPGIYDGINSLKIPVYMQQRHDDIPLSIEYPKEKMVEKFGKMFTSTFCYMLALAIEEGFDVIGLYGAHMDNYQEYWQERYAIYYFAGIAKAKGIEIIIPDEAPILKPELLYGYEFDDHDNFFYINRKYVQEQLDELKEEEQRILNHLDVVANNIIGYQALIKEFETKQVNLTTRGGK